MFLVLLVAFVSEERVPGDDEEAAQNLAGQPEVLELLPSPSSPSSSFSR